MPNSIRIKWSIKGYHYFHIRPHPEINMKVEQELINPRDPYAVKVSMPALEEIPPQYHDDITRDGIQSRPRQTVRQIAGRQVGRVPANLSKAFFFVLERNLTERIQCKYTGVIAPSRNPPVQQRYQRNINARDRPGGGVDIECEYMLTVSRRNFEPVMHILEQYVPMEDLDSRLYA